MLKCEQGVPAGGLAARRPEEHGLQRDLEKSLGKKKHPTQSPAQHNLGAEQGEKRASQGNVDDKESPRETEEKGSLSLPGMQLGDGVNHGHKKETGKLAERSGDWKLQQSSSERAGRTGRVAWLSPGSVTIRRGVSSALRGREP